MRASDLILLSVDDNLASADRRCVIARIHHPLDSAFLPLEARSVGNRTDDGPPGLIHQPRAPIADLLESHVLKWMHRVLEA
jgi:hypothetical protein